MIRQNRRVATVNVAAANSLERIKDEIAGLVADAHTIIRRAGDPQITARAESYWLSHILDALGTDEDSGYSASSMSDTIRELRGQE